MDEETKKKISLALEGRPKPPRSAEHRRNMSLAFAGRTYKERFGKEQAAEIIAKRSAKLKGQKRVFRNPEVWRKNLSQALKGRQVWNKGRKGLQKAWNKIEVPKDWLYQKYVIEDRSTKQLAAESNFSRWVIQRALKEYNTSRKTAKDFLSGKTYAEIHGRSAEEIRAKIHQKLKGRKITWGNKISKILKEKYKNGFPEEFKLRLKEQSTRLWKNPDYRARLVASHKKYLQEHPEEFERLKKIQYPGRPTSIEKKVCVYLKENYEEGKDFLFDKFDITKKTFYRPDFQFPSKKIIIELDGHYKHFSPDGIEKDKKREQELVAAGWKIYRFNFWEITRNFDTVKTKIAEILKNG